MDAVVLLLLLWQLLGLGLVLQAWGRSRAGVEDVPPVAAPPPWSLRALAGLTLALVALRATLALLRPGRNVDEFQYAAQAAWARLSGESLFELPWGFRGHAGLYLLGGEDPFALVDVLTSLAAGATAFLLGLALLRAGRGVAAALLTAACYGLGALNYEGLTSNAEAWANLALAGWVVLRLGVAPAGPEGGWRRPLLAGACLGAAFVMKEQAALFVLAEAFVGALELGQDRAPGRLARQARRSGAAALGCLAVLGAWFLGYLLHGRLDDYLGFLLSWGADAGAPGGGPVPAGAGAGEEGGEGELPLGLRLLAGLLPLLGSPVGWLGLAHLGRLVVEVRRLGTPARRLEAGLAGLAVCGLVAASLGLRWFGHYFLLTLPGLAPLAALLAVEGVHTLRDGLRPATRRPRSGPLLGATGLLLAGALVFTVLQTGRLLNNPSFAQGYSLDPGGPRERVQGVGLALDRLLPPREPILVWGWRPEVYAAARRPPASSSVGGTRPDLARVLEEVARTRPAAVVIPGEHGLGGREDDPFALERHPPLLEWLVREGYLAHGVRAHGYTILFRPDVVEEGAR